MPQTAGQATKPRPRHELVMVVIQPLARRGVAALARTPVEPWQVVVAHSLLGLLAAFLIAGTSAAGWLVAAALLQVKSLLDNIDGGLARATGRVSELGRYLDTGLDLLVNVALFMALSRHGPAGLAVAALLVLTLVLSCDHVAEKLYHAARAGGANAKDEAGAGKASGGDDAPHAPRQRRESVPLLAFRGLYRLVLAPQDAALARLDARLFEVASGRPAASARTPERQRWNDLYSTAALVNLGLSSQYLLLGVCLVLATPFTYVYLVLLQAVYVGVVQWSRVIRYRRGPSQ